MTDDQNWMEDESFYDGEAIEFVKNYGVTAAIIAINIIVFIMLEIIGDTENSQFMLEHGAVYPPCIIDNGEYWRLFTATFMHFGIMHLLNNMVLLAAAGRILEKALGHICYLILYLAAGLGGSTLSYLQMLYSGDYAVAAGASGAIFGIIGSLLWIVVVHKGRYESITGKGLCAMIVLCLYYGITAGDVDNWGHIGGLIVGFVCGIIFYHRKKQKD